MKKQDLKCVMYAVSLTIEGKLIVEHFSESSLQLLVLSFSVSFLGGDFS